MYLMQCFLWTGFSRRRLCFCRVQNQFALLICSEETEMYKFVLKLLKSIFWISGYSDGKARAKSWVCTWAPVQSVKNADCSWVEGWCLLLKLCKNLKLKYRREGLGFLVLHPCSIHISKASLGTSSGSYLNSWRVGCLPSSQYFPVWKAGEVPAKKKGRNKGVIWRWPAAGAMLLLPVCAAPARISLLGVWAQNICSSCRPWQPCRQPQGHPCKHPSWCLDKPEWRHGAQEGHICSIRHALCCGAGKSCCSGRHYWRNKVTLPSLKLSGKMPLRVASPCWDCHRGSSELYTFDTKLKSG